MVIPAHAIIYPLAMMVIFFHAPITNIAVARVFFVNCFAVGAHRLRVVLFDQFVEFKVFYRVLVARVSQSCSQEKDIYDNEHGINRVSIFVKRVER